MNPSHLLHLADNVLILAQRNAEWCGHGPVLEQDIALTNITLDLVGQARSLYQYAATLKGKEVTEDHLAYLRLEQEYLNVLLVEQPNGDWAQTVLRQFFFSAWQSAYYTQLENCPDKTLSAIAEKSMKEIRYHLRWSSEWVIRLGDGTEESHSRMVQALENLWPYTGEMLEPASYEQESGFIHTDSLRQEWNQTVNAVLEEATLPLPGPVFMQEGGKSGRHTEHMGYILSELQYLQRAYPNSQW